MRRYKRKPKKLIIDTSVFSEFVHMGLLEKLIEYKDFAKVKIILPENVRKELVKERADQKIREALDYVIKQHIFQVVNPSKEEINELRFRYPSLGEGEIGVLATALALKQSSSQCIIPILDDRQARKKARKIGLKVHGTLWLLIDLKKHGILKTKSVIRIVSKLPSHGFFITDEKLREIVEYVKKDC